MDQHATPQEIVETPVKAPWQAPKLSFMPVPEFTASADCCIVDAGLTGS